MNLTITAYSTALFSTWYFIEELGILFDVGDGVCSALLQKTRKINHVFISHADRDHVTGLLQFNQLNGRPGFPIIHYPKDSGTFPALEHFTQKFDPHITGTIWKPVIENEKIWIRKDLFVQTIRNNHIPAAEGIHKSFGYKVVSVKKKLKAEYLALHPNEIKKMILEKGNDEMMDEIFTTILCFSGDTPVENFEHWDNAEILIHEATFIGEEDKNKAHGNKHCELEDVIRSVSKINIQKLILGHFSSRYSDEFIDSKTKEFCKKYKLEIPVYRVLPGQVVRDVFKSKVI